MGTGQSNFSWRNEEWAWARVETSQYQSMHGFWVATSVCFSGVLRKALCVVCAVLVLDVPAFKAQCSMPFQRGIPTPKNNYISNRDLIERIGNIDSLCHAWTPWHSNWLAYLRASRTNWFSISLTFWVESWIEKHEGNILATGCNLCTDQSSCHALGRLVCLCGVLRQFTIRMMQSDYMESFSRHWHVIWRIDLHLQRKHVLFLNFINPSIHSTKKTPFA